MKEEKKSGWIPVLLIAAATLFLIIVLLLPLVYVLVTAFRDGVRSFYKSDYRSLCAKFHSINTLCNIDHSYCEHHFWIICILADYKISVQREKYSVGMYRSASYHFTDHCRSDLSSYVWQKQYSLSIIATCGNSDRICGSGYCTRNHFCYLSIHFKRSNTGPYRSWGMMKKRQQR